MDKEIKPIIHGWSEGISEENLRGWGGTIVHRKGQTVRYRKMKNVDGPTEYQYHVVNQQNMELLRTSRLKIKGVELVDYWQVLKNKEKN